MSSKKESMLFNKAMKDDDFIPMKKTLLKRST